MERGWDARPLPFLLIFEGTRKHAIKRHLRDSIHAATKQNLFQICFRVAQALRICYAQWQNKSVHPHPQAYATQIREGNFEKLTFLTRTDAAQIPHPHPFQCNSNQLPFYSTFSSFPILGSLQLRSTSMNATLLPISRVFMFTFGTFVFKRERKPKIVWKEF